MPFFLLVWPRTRLGAYPQWDGIDVERFRGGLTADVCRWLDVPPDSRIILTVGNYRPIRGHEVIVRVMPQILKLCPRRNW